jgi:hypothetical protein
VVSVVEVKGICGAIWFSVWKVVAEIYELLEAPDPAAGDLECASTLALTRK